MSFVTGSVLERIAGELAVGEGDVLADLACGRGGPGLWLARRLDVRLIGVDFSAVAIEQAQARAGGFLPAGQAEFRVGDLQDTGLANESVAAAVCIDAFHFAPDTDAAAVEVRRVLRPGGRFVLTTWEPVDPDDATLPSRMRNRSVRALEAAGFVSVRAEERPEMLDAQRRVYELALDTDQGVDPALDNLRDEAESVLPLLDRLRRLFVVTERTR